MKNLKLMGMGLLSFLMIGISTVKAEVIEVKDEAELKTCAETSGNTCKLTDNIVLSSQFVIEKENTIDLNGKSITPDAALKLSQGLIVVYREAKLTVNDSVGSGKISGGSSDNVWGGIQLVRLDDADETKAAELVVNGGTIEAYYYGIVGNGSYHNTKITINGGTIKGFASDSLGIYHPQDGVLTVNGGTIEGGTGIEIRSGSLTVNGGTIRGFSVPTTVLANGNGSTTDGTGIGIAQHNTKKAINVTVNGGTIEGYTAFYESNPQKNTATDIAKITLAINGGTFNAINGGVNTVYSEDFENFVKSGVFSHEVETKYIALDGVSRTEGSNYRVGKIYTITVNNATNGSISTDVENGMSNDVVKLTLTPNDGYELKEIVVKDANGNMLSVTDNSFVLPESNVTVSATFSESIIETDMALIDTTTTPKTTMVGVSDSDATSKVLIETLKENKELAEEIKNTSVIVALDIKELAKTDADVEKIEKVLEDNKINNAKVGDFFDISVVVKNANTNDVLGTLPELQENIKLTVALSEDLLDIPEGYVRTYYIIRDHNGIYEVLDTELAKDNKSLTFSSNKFSSYAIAYVDALASNNNNAQTGSNVMLYIIILSISSLGIAGIYLKANKKVKNN